MINNSIKAVEVKLRKIENPVIKITFYMEEKGENELT